jgi:hypothetical protein
VFPTGSARQSWTLARLVEQLVLLPGLEAQTLAADVIRVLLLRTVSFVHVLFRLTSILARRISSLSLYHLMMIYWQLDQALCLQMMR